MICVHFHIHIDFLHLFYWLAKIAFYILSSEMQNYNKTQPYTGYSDLNSDKCYSLEVLLQEFSLYKHVEKPRTETSKPCLSWFWLFFPTEELSPCT